MAQPLSKDVVHPPQGSSCHNLADSSTLIAIDRTLYQVEPKKSQEKANSNSHHHANQRRIENLLAGIKTQDNLSHVDSVAKVQGKAQDNQKVITAAAFKKISAGDVIKAAH